MSNNGQATMVPKLALRMGAVLCETFFFGVYSALFVFTSSFVLCRRSPSMTRNAMLALSAVMYAVSASHCTLNVADSLRALKIGRFSRTPIKQIVVVYLPTINYILSDGIVLWRAWVLWNRRCLLFVPPLITLVCTLVASIAAAAYAYEGYSKHSAHAITMSHYFGWFIWGFSISTNIWATALIFIRTWQHRRFLRSLLGKATVATNTEKALVFLVESGALYLCIWTAYITTTLTDPKGVLLFNTTIVQLVGIYPTTIVVVVTMRLSTADILSHPRAAATCDSSIVFKPPPSPIPPQSCPADDVEGYSSDGECIVISHDAISTRTLVSSIPDK